MNWYVIIGTVLILGLAVLSILIFLGFFDKSPDPPSVTGKLVSTVGECTTSSDCGIGTCVNGSCKVDIGVPCSSGTQCETGLCKGGICTKPYNATCSTDQECSTGICDEGKCDLGIYSKCQKYPNDTCPDNMPELVCSLGHCSLKTNSVCTLNSQCETKYCKEGKCAPKVPIYELKKPEVGPSLSDVMYSNVSNEAVNLGYYHTGTVIELFPKASGGLIPLNRCYSGTKHYLGLNNSCFKSPVVGVTVADVEPVLGYVRPYPTSSTGIDPTESVYSLCYGYFSGPTESKTFRLRRSDFSDLANRCLAGEYKVFSFMN